MKKSYLISALFLFIFTLSVETGFATETKTEDNTNKLVLKMNDAIYRRLLNSFQKHTVRNLKWKNVYNRKNRLIEKKINANVAGPSVTGAAREGELDDGYQGLHQQPSYYSMGHKGDWRRCAVKYYVEGVQCTPEEMMKDVLLGSVHKVDTVPDIFWKQDVAIINDVRSVQRLLESGPMIGAGQQVQRFDSKVSSLRDVGATPYQKLPDFLKNK